MNWSQVLKYSNVRHQNPLVFQSNYSFYRKHFSFFSIIKSHARVEKIANAKYIRNDIFITCRFKRSTYQHVNANIKFKMKKGFHVIYCLVTCKLKGYRDREQLFFEYSLEKPKHEYKHTLFNIQNITLLHRLIILLYILIG